MLSYIACFPSQTVHFKTPQSKLQSPNSKLPTFSSDFSLLNSQIYPPTLTTNADLLPPISHLSSPTYHLPPPSPTSHLLPPISHLPSPTSYLPLPISHLPSPTFSHTRLPLTFKLKYNN